ncbi:cystinosin-like isoform X2 [Macrobrachium nipponense]
MDMLIHSSEQVNLSLSSPPDTPFNISFSSDGDVLEDVEAIYVSPSSPLSWVVTLNSTSNGKTLFRAEPDVVGVVASDDAFIRVSVMINPAINVVADVLGWVYTIAWDISFLPQIYKNWKRKSVVGLAFDFLTLNFIGFFSYMMYNIGNLWIPEIQAEFHDRHPTSVMHVRLNDVIFPMYALLCTAIQIVQCIFYKRDPGQRVSMTCRVISSLMIAAEVIVLIIAASSDLLQWLDLLLCLSYIKILVTCIKYIPQLYMNYKVQSTEGWSIWQVILDCTGGSLSLIQMFMLASNYADWNSVLRDPAKLGLGLLSIFFNIFSLCSTTVFTEESKFVQTLLQRNRSALTRKYPGNRLVHQSAASNSEEWSTQTLTPTSELLASVLRLLSVARNHR